MNFWQWEQSVNKREKAEGHLRSAVINGFLDEGYRLFIDSERKPTGIQYKMAISKHGRAGWEELEPARMNAFSALLGVKGLRWFAEYPETVAKLPIPPWAVIRYTGDGEEVQCDDEFLAVLIDQWVEYKRQVEDAISLALKLEGNGPTADDYVDMLHAMPDFLRSSRRFIILVEAFENTNTLHEIVPWNRRGEEASRLIEQAKLQVNDQKSAFFSWKPGPAGDFGAVFVTRDMELARCIKRVYLHSHHIAVEVFIVRSMGDKPDQWEIA